MNLNANGLLQHKENLTVILVDQKIDACFISETRFTGESYIKLRGCDVYHARHPNNCARVGSAVIIKNEISHHEDIKIEKAEFQVTSAKIKTTSSVITVASIYSPPKHNLKIED